MFCEISRLFDSFAIRYELRGFLVHSIQVQTGYLLRDMMYSLGGIDSAIVLLQSRIH